MENTPEKFNPLEKFKIQNQARFYFTVVKIARGREKKTHFRQNDNFSDFILRGKTTVLMNTKSSLQIKSILGLP